jgi:hypothetical protein
MITASYTKVGKVFLMFVYNMLHYKVILHVLVYTLLHNDCCLFVLICMVICLVL